MNDFLDKELFGNHISDYLLAVAVFLIVLVVIWLAEKFVLSKARKLIRTSKNQKLVIISDSFHKRIVPIINVAAIYAAFQFIDISPKAYLLINKIVVIVVVFFVLLFVTDLVKNLFKVFSKDEANIPGGIITILQVIVWVIGLLFMLANLGFNVTTFIAGLGIGGVAIALASQSILGDLFNYFVILFDKPFEKGNYIQVDDKSGTVEYIGIKSTRVRSITGELLLISNTDLTKSRIHNFEVMEQRRVDAKIGVEYSTDIQKLKRIPGIITKIIEANKMTEPSRVTFSELGTFSLNFTIVYFVCSNDIIRYAKVVEEVNFAIAEAFAKEGISFAFPTQNIQLLNIPKNQF